MHDLSRVVKRGLVKAGPPRSLSGNSPAPARPAQAAAARSGQPKAVLVESTTAAAVIEITCGCGAKVYLKCDYEQAAPEAAETT